MPFHFKFVQKIEFIHTFMLSVFDRII